jgi:hypothetical protein
MHLGAGHPGKHLERSGEIKLGHFWKYHETDLERGGHDEPFEVLFACTRHCEERSDEAIHSFLLRPGGLLRFVRNDGESQPT